MDTTVPCSRLVPHGSTNESQHRVCLPWCGGTRYEGDFRWYSFSIEFIYSLLKSHFLPGQNVKHGVVETDYE
eukprot:1340972-Amorphochlora_amoeboformis.AAC.2